jgi:hypothetical protein
MAMGIFLNTLGLGQYVRSGSGAASTAGQAIGLLLVLTKAS